MKFTAYPLKMRPIFKERVWGGSNLKTALNKKIYGHKKIGESWEISTVGENISIIENGKYRNVSLLELVNDYSEQLLGGNFKNSTVFPLLYKFIDATENLSVQLHPDKEKAFKLEKKYIGKTEGWYIIKSKTNKIILDFDKKLSYADIKKEIRNNQIENILNYHTAAAGDFVYIPAGTVHAILANTLIAEIQEPSDITYRLYDWNRNLADRPLNIEKCLISLKNNRKQLLQITACKSSGIVNLFHNKIFKIDLLTSKKSAFYSNNYFIILSNLGGNCSIEIFNSSREEFQFNKGETILMPAVIDYFKIKSKKNTHILAITKI